MSLTHKITSLLLAVFGLFFAAQLLIHHKVLRPSFDRLERAEAITDVERCRDAIFQELAHLSTLCNDWAVWDDSYQFVMDRNQDFIDSTLTGDVLDVAHLSLLMYCRNDGQIVWMEAASSVLEPADILAAFPSKQFDPNHFLLQHASLESDVSGVMLVSGYPLLIVSRPILTSDAEGPKRGTLVMARMLDEDLNALLEERTHVTFSTLNPDMAAATLSRDEAEMLTESDRLFLRV
ncbi:MAG: hypothetical protein IIB04_07480, partial [Acidobacteria bacterium]|nr:hypothetical protein [Acidobacteriota bacterium]